MDLPWFASNWTYEQDETCHKKYPQPQPSTPHGKIKKSHFQLYLSSNIFQNQPEKIKGHLEKSVLEFLWLTTYFSFDLVNSVKVWFLG